MTNPFSKVTSVGPRDRPKEPGVTFKGKRFGANGSDGHDADIRDATADTDTTVLPFPSGSQRGGRRRGGCGSWLSELLLGSVHYSIALFAGLKRTIPTQELSLFMAEARRGDRTRGPSHRWSKRQSTILRRGNAAGSAVRWAHARSGEEKQPATDRKAALWRPHPVLRASTHSRHRRERRVRA